MKFYKSKDNAVYAYDDDIDDSLIKKGLIEISESEALAIANPPPSEKELIMMAEQLKSNLMDEASRRISVLQDAVDLDIATTEETSSLLVWKKYRVLLNRVDTAAPVWPTAPTV